MHEQAKAARLAFEARPQNIREAILVLHAHGFSTHEWATESRWHVSTWETSGPATYGHPWVTLSGDL